MSFCVRVKRSLIEITTCQNSFDDDDSFTISDECIEQTSRLHSEISHRTYLIITAGIDLFTYFGIDNYKRPVLRLSVL